jgi:hypothetical protein
VQDEWLPERLRALTEIVSAEGRLFRAVMDLLAKWATKLRNAVFGGQQPSTITPPDPLGIYATVPWFGNQIDDLVEVTIREILDEAADDGEDPIPEAATWSQDYLNAAKNRLVGIPDRVFADVRAQTMKATTDGWAISELADEVDKILAEAGAERWRNRALVIARTEAIGAYNGGKFLSFQSIAHTVPGAWEKAWLSTEDERTRPTHVEADRQRVPLLEPFTVGGFPGMFPGDPALPAHEVIQCRCSIILLAEGEKMNYAGRHFKKGRA